MSTPRASIVVPTMNAGPLFEEVLRRLFSQETDFDYEVVIDSGSTDGTVGRALRHGILARQPDGNLPGRQEGANLQVGSRIL